jgi:hypothetical protein
MINPTDRQEIKLIEDENDLPEEFLDEFTNGKGSDNDE